MTRDKRFSGNWLVEYEKFKVFFFRNQLQQQPSLESLINFSDRHSNFHFFRQTRSKFSVSNLTSMNPIELSFDDILSSSRSGDDPEYHAEAEVFEYIEEISQLEDKIAKCSAEREAAQRQQEVLKMMMGNDAKEVLKLRNELSAKDEEIKQLKIQLTFSKQHQSPSKITTTRIKPEEITDRVHLLERRIITDRNHYQQSGKYDNLEQRISEVRQLFNQLLLQLNELNSQNKCVTRTLQCLMQLDVKLLFSFSVLKIKIFNLFSDI